jgi:hypothetical protein
MKRFLERTWVATLAITIAAAGVAAVFAGPYWTLVSGTTALLTTPIVWWVLVGRRQKPGIGWGILAGGFLGGTSHLLTVLPGWISTYGIHRDELPNDVGLGGLPTLIVVGMIIYCAAITTVICSVAGAVIVIAERPSNRAPQAS